MKKFLIFLRTANAQLNTLINRTISLLQLERRAQLVAVVAVSVFIGGFVTAITHSARATREQWVSHVQVRVTTASVAVGDAFNNNNTDVVDMPEAVIADDAISEIPKGARARVALQPHTPLSTSLLLLDGSTVAIPNGWRGIAMPNDLIVPNVFAGDHVDVIAGDAVVAEGALVVSASKDSGITIAVPAAQSPVVASAARVGDISLVLAN
jgi:Flp pilus assembly protein CpaB